MNIPILDLKAQYLAHRQEIDAAILGVIDARHFILGPNVKALEEEVAAYTGCRFGIGVASGTDALRLALAALEIGPGDEVITTPFTFVATANTISHAGATPVFVDIDPRTFNIAPDLVEKAVTSRTKAIVPVHLFGQTAEMEPLMAIARRYGLRIIEDAAQAIGAEEGGQRAGSLGDIGCFSFYPNPAKPEPKGTQSCTEDSQRGTKVSCQVFLCEALCLLCAALCHHFLAQCARISS